MKPLRRGSTCNLKLSQPTKKGNGDMQTEVTDE